MAVIEEYIRLSEYQEIRKRLNYQENMSNQRGIFADILIFRYSDLLGFINGVNLWIF